MKPLLYRLQRRLLMAALLFLGIAQSLSAFQTNSSLRLSKLYQDILNSNKTQLVYKNIRLVDDISEPEAAGDDFIEKLSDILNVDIPVDSSGIITKVQSIFFSHISGTDIAFRHLNLGLFKMDSSRFEHLYFKDVNMDTLELTDNSGIRLNIRDSRFNEYLDEYNSYAEYEVYRSVFNGYYEFRDSKIGSNFWIYDSEFHEGAYTGPEFIGVFADFKLDGCTFYPIDSNLALQLDEEDAEPVVYKTQALFNFFGKLNQMYMTNNQFLNDEHEQFVFLSGEFDYMSVEGNTIESYFFPDASVNKQLMLFENEVTGKLVFASWILEGKNNIMYWRELGGFKMANALIASPSISDPMNGHNVPEELSRQVAKQTGDVAFVIYNGDKDEEFEEEDNFQALISSYYRLYKVFKDNGQINDANQVYVEMKDVQLRKFRYLSKEYGGLENLIQWRLNALLKFYTDYGTNPARAIRISIFVVLSFSVFYFFFPSEWDTKSKKQLIDDYRTFIQKNQHGYFKPLLKLSAGFLKSLVNAMTLSLNAFVTLGFGTIPTSGLARYVCILQGFMGWFLLSIFTASLINQVLF